MTLLNLLMAVLLASAPLVCSPLPLLASPPHFWTFVDMFAVFAGGLGGGGGSSLGPFCLFLCGSAAVLLPLLSCMETCPPPPLKRGVQLSVAPSSSCVDLHSDWFVQLSLVLDLTMWPRLL